jgi:uncharacterized protein
MNFTATAGRSAADRSCKKLQPNSTAWNFPSSRNRLEYRRMLDKDLLDLLVCPACKAALLYDSAQDTLTCSQCRRVYPVREGIPILLIDQATREQA